MYILKTITTEDNGELNDDLVKKLKEIPMEFVGYPSTEFPFYGEFKNGDVMMFSGVSRVKTLENKDIVITIKPDITLTFTEV